MLNGGGGIGIGGNSNGKGKKYVPALGGGGVGGGGGVRHDDGGSLASLMLSSKINTIENKNKQYLITLYGEDVKDAFGTSESIGQCVSFCPRNLHQIIKDGHGSVQGCILIVDISGFTKLSSTLCLQGSTGIDLLRKITDNSFAQFVECVYQHGGDVIEFAGDSVLCLFKSEEEFLSNACCNAVRCGLNVSKFHIDGTHTHVGISCGTISISLIGGYHDQYTYLMNSKSLETVGHCLTVAGEQELVIDDAVFSHVETAFTFSEVVSNEDNLFYKITGERSTWPIMTLGRKKYETPPGTPGRTSLAINSTSTDSDHHSAVSPYGRKASAFSPLIGGSTQPIRPDFSRAHLSLDERSARQIMSCVPRPVLQGIITNSLSGLSEMRTVTTLFLKLDSFSFDTFNDPAQLHEFFINMQKCLFECGGMLRQFLIDDKGCVLIGLWGVPTASHAANCSKALRCAVMMQNVTKDLGYSTSIGVTTGSVYCGIVGTQYRRDYVAIGRSVNLAARLMCKAHGRILLDDETFRRLPLNVTCYTSLTEKLNLKGIESAANFHCYWSTTLPISTTDISNDRVLVIESYVRRDIHLFLESPSTPKSVVGNESSDTITVTGAGVYHNRPKLLARKSFDETATQYNHTTASSFSSTSKILIIRGTSASGKTALVNYTIRRIIEPQASNTNFLAPVYVCLTADDDSSITSYSTIKKIIGALFAWTQLDGNNQGEFLQRMLLGSFPKYSESVVANFIYPPLRQALGFTWEWNIPQDNSPNPFENTEKSFQLMLSEFLYFVLSDGIPVVAIDDAHFMCSGSWSVISMLSRMGCSARIILAIRVHESNSSMPFDSLRYSHETNDDANLLDRSLTPGARTSLNSANDSPSRHCSEYLALCRVVDPQSLFDVVLKPLSRRTLRRILEKEFPMELIPQETIDTVCAISRGNPFLLWKIIQYVHDSGTLNIAEVISNIKDNSFMVSMLDNLPQSHCAVLKLASVVGEEFSTDLLEMVVPPPLIKQLSSALQNLENRGFLATLNNGHHIFSSSVIRKFVYDLIPPSDAQETHRHVAHQIERLYSDSLYSHRNRLCYHYSMSGYKAHKALTVKYSIQLIEEYMERREVESTIPFLAVAMKSATTRSEFHHLKELLSKGITICTEHVSHDQSCHHDALSAYTLSRLVEMHATASTRDTFRYSMQSNYLWIRNYLTRIFKRNTVVPLLFSNPSFDNVNSPRAPSFHSQTSNPAQFPSTFPSSISLI